MTYDTNSIQGGSWPGVPLILIGRSNHLSWGSTASMTDVSDLFKENVKGNQYLVDGEW